MSPPSVEGIGVLLAMSIAIVPPLTIASPPRLRTTEAHDGSIMSPRTGCMYKLHTPRTSREQLQLTGMQLNEALEAVEQLGKKIAELSARGHQQRQEFVSNLQTSPGADVCPICLDRLRGPVACCNSHQFCGNDTVARMLDLQACLSF